MQINTNRIFLNFQEPYWLIADCSYETSQGIKDFIGFKYDSQIKKWKFRINYLYIFLNFLKEKELCSQFGLFKQIYEMHFSPEVQSEYQKLSNQLAILKNIVDRSKTNSENFDEYQNYRDNFHFCKKSLKNIQIAGCLWLTTIKKGILAFDTGVGKTFTALEACYLINKTKGKEKILIITPSKIKTQWGEEIENNFPKAKIFNTSDAEKLDKRLKLYEEFYNYDGMRFLVTNFEKIRLDLQYLKTFDIIIIDEASKIKSVKTKTSSNVKNNRASIKELCKNAEYVFALTATPLETNYFNYYGIFNVIDEDFFSGGITRFAERYFEKDYFGLYKKIRRENEKELSDYIRNYIFKSNTKLNVASKTHKIVLEFSFPEMTKYNSINQSVKDELLLKKKFNIATDDPLYVEKREKYLEEISQMALFLSTNRKYQFVDFPQIVFPETYDNLYVSPKMKWLIENLPKLPGKTIIFDSRTESTNRIFEILNNNGINAFVIDGSTFEKKRNTVIKNFKESTDINVLICSDCLSYGANMQFAQNMVFFNLTLTGSASGMKQRAGRILRTGQKNEVNIYLLMMKDTFEDKIYKRMTSRLMDAKKILTGDFNLTKKDILQEIEAS